MIVISLINEKGGVGKTTLATHIAAGLSIRGYKTLLIDADPQGHASASLGMRSEPGLYNLLVRPDDYDIKNVIRQVPAAHYASGTPTGELHLLPGNTESRSIPDHVDDSDALRDTLERLQGVDVAVIDTPPTPGMLMALVYGATDYVIIPTQAEALSISGMMATIQRAHKADAKLLGIAVNLYEQNTVLHRHNLKLLVEASTQQGWRLWSPIAQATAWREASQARRTVFSLLPNSKATTSAQELVMRVEQALAYV